MAQSEFRKNLLSLWVKRLIFSIGKYFCASGYFRRDLLVEARKQFANWFSINCLIRQGEFQCRNTRIAFVARHLASLVHSLHAHQKSHFLRSEERRVGKEC